MTSELCPEAGVGAVQERVEAGEKEGHVQNGKFLPMIMSVLGLWNCGLRVCVSPCTYLCVSLCVYLCIYVLCMCLRLFVCVCVLLVCLYMSIDTSVYVCPCMCT